MSSKRQKESDKEDRDSDDFDSEDDLRACKASYKVSAEVALKRDKPSISMDETMFCNSKKDNKPLGKLVVHKNSGQWADLLPKSPRKSKHKGKRPFVKGV